ncbi:MAG: hypothetical protein HFI71_00780 [Lachnospiraceae bacterium]|nr:hypothetical protein [Lachnospiraceae bacterium]
MKELNAKKKLHIFLIFLIGILVSVMLVMMRMGGSINFNEFMSADRVHDVSPIELQRDSSTWSYDKEKNGFWLLSDKAFIRYLLDGEEQVWNYLYITVEQMSTESLEGMIKFFNKDGKKTAEQIIGLTKGKNMIVLDGDIPMQKLGIMISDAQGQFISISAIQVRTTPSWFTIPHFLKLFVPIFVVVMAVIIVLVRLGRRFKIKKKIDDIYVFIDIIQNSIQIMGDFFGSRIGGKLSTGQRKTMRRFLFSLLWVWMLVGNVAGWLNDLRGYRFHMLICAILLLVISFVSWEQPLVKQLWRKPLMVSWLWLWLGMIICDFFVVKKIESAVGYTMLLSGVIFIFFWQNMEKPDLIFYDMTVSLEITFFIGIVFCIFFRMKKPAIDYHGMFQSSEELSMYAVLMAVIFFTEINWIIDKSMNSSEQRNRKKEFYLCLKNILGAGASLFLILRSNHMPGILAFLLISILYMVKALRRIDGDFTKCRELFLNFAVAVIFAYLGVCMIYVGTKYLPGILNLDLEYQQEVYLTKLTGEDKELFTLQYPGSMNHVQTKEIEKLSVIWQNYARRLNLFGHKGELIVFRREIPAYSSYLSMAYHYGIFILVPYIVFQLTMLTASIRGMFSGNKRRTASILFLAVGIAYLCFAVTSNAEIPWGHPLWLCYYLSVGYLGAGRIKKSKENAVV